MKRPLAALAISLAAGLPLVPHHAFAQQVAWQPMTAPVTDITALSVTPRGWRLDRPRQSNVALPTITVDANAVAAALLTTEASKRVLKMIGRTPSSTGMWVTRLTMSMKSTKMGDVAVTAPALDKPFYVAVGETYQINYNVDTGAIWLSVPTP